MVTVSLSLTARTNKNGKVWIDGDRTKTKLRRGDPPHLFSFTLDDKTKPSLNVEFDSLDTEDDWPECPPPGGQNSTQISSVTITPDAASFVDSNSNTNGAMDVCYRWNFKCDDANQHPTFDPIIDNGGR
jgi:hypothetical protein